MRSHSTRRRCSSLRTRTPSSTSPLSSLGSTTSPNVVRRAHATASAAHLFRSEGFHGNDVDYYDPENSFLDAVLDRRTGIPITLSVVLIEVGRRLGVPLVGVGAPGHFIVLDQTSGAFIDPFNGGRILDHDDRTRLYGATPLESVGPRAIVSRVLANLKGIYTQHGDLDGLRWVVRLRVLFPDVPDEERAQLARLMAPMN